MSEPMVIPVESRCSNCGYVATHAVRDDQTGEPIVEYGKPTPLALVRRMFSMSLVCRSGCGEEAQFLVATEPVPGMGEPYPATEPDEDAAYEYAREQALEDAR